MQRNLAKKIFAGAVGFALPAIIAASCTQKDAEAPPVEPPTTAAQYRMRAGRATKEFQWEAAERLYQSAISKLQAANNNDNGLELAGTLNDFGRMCEQSRDLTQAKAVSNKSLALCRNVIESPSFAGQTTELQDKWLTEKARAMFVLANADRDLGNYDEAESEYRKVFALQKQLGAKLKDLQVEAEYEAFKNCLVRQKGLDVRISMQNSRMQWKNEHHYKDYLTEHQHLLQAMSAGNIGEVERLEPIVLQQVGGRFGKQATEYEESLRDVANFYRTHNLFDRAAALYVGEVNDLEANLPKKKDTGSRAALNDDLELLRIDLVALSDIYNAQGKRDQSTQVLEKAMAFTKMKDGDTVLEQGDLAGLIGNQYFITGHKQAAEKQYKAAMKLKLARRGKKSIEYANALCNLGTLYVDEHRRAEAKPVLEEAQSIFEATTDGDAPTRAYISQTIGDFLITEGKSSQALPLLRASVEEVSKWSGPKDIASAWYHLGVACHNAGQLDEAVSSLEQTMRIFNAGGLPNSPDFISASALLAQCYCQQHQEKRAEPLLKQAIAASREIHDTRLENLCLAQYKTLLQSEGRKLEADQLKP
jgi:tetratricopeptide (TPR) repeat protein